LEFAVELLRHGEARAPDLSRRAADGADALVGEAGALAVLLLDRTSNTPLGLLARVHEGEGEVLDAALLFVRETDALAGLGLDRARGVLIGAREVRGELLFRGALERERAEARPGDAEKFVRLNFE
jgi:hypothetical protein